MDNVILIPGAQVEHAALPEELRLTEDELQTHIEENGVPPTFVVPTDTELQEQETALEGMLIDLSRLRTARESIQRHGNRLSAVAVATLTRATECSCEKPSFVDPAAFQTGEQGAGEYALESVAAAEQGILARFFELLKSWARGLYLWISERLSRRNAANEGLKALKTELSTIVSIPLTQGGYQALRLLPAAILNHQGVEAAVDKAASSIDALTAEMRDLMASAASMFAENTTSKAGKFLGADSTSRLAGKLKGRVMYNLPAVGGISWNIQVDPLKTYDGGDMYYRFFVQTHSVTREHVDGTIPQAQFRNILQAVEKALTQSETIINNLSTYAKAMTSAARPGMNTSQNVFGATRVSIDMAPFTAVISAATALRGSFKLYDRVVLAAANDVVRAGRYANKK